MPHDTEERCRVRACRALRCMMKRRSRTTNITSRSSSLAPALPTIFVVARNDPTSEKMLREVDPCRWTPGCHETKPARHMPRPPREVGYEVTQVRAHAACHGGVAHKHTSPCTITVHRSWFDPRAVWLSSLYCGSQGPWQGGDARGSDEMAHGRTAGTRIDH
jgi:hypothetical protein